MTASPAYFSTSASRSISSAIASKNRPCIIRTLGILALGELRRADEIDEDHGRELALVDRIRETWAAPQASKRAPSGCTALQFAQTDMPRVFPTGAACRPSGWQDQRYRSVPV